MNQYLMVILCLIGVALGHIVVDQTTFDRPSGSWSGYIVADPNFGDNPSQHFLCGVQFRKKLWSIVVREYAGRRWFRRRYKNVEYKYYDKTNAINLIFCRSTDWKDQIEKTFESGDPANAGWRDKVYCPQGSFVNGVASRFSVIRQTDQGLSGLKLSCVSSTLAETTDKQDATGQQLSQIRRGQRGNFVSGVRIKFEDKDKLSGIHFSFEPMPVITKVQFTYSTISNIELVPQVVNTAAVDNFGSQTVSKKVRIQKQFQFTNNWRTENTFSRTYSTSVQASASFFGFGASASYSQSFQRTSSFAFGKQIRSSFAIDQQIYVPIPPCTAVLISTILKQKTIDLPFTALVTFSRLTDRQFIVKKSFGGIWSGTLTSNIDHKVEQKKIVGCQANANLKKEKTL